MQINKLILGTVQMGIPYGINNNYGQIQIEESFKILGTAYNAGIRILDTAEAYGTAHQVIGDFHRNNSRKLFKIITKLPHHIDESIDQKIEKYLNELNVTQLEGLLFHSYQTYKDNKSSMPLLNAYRQSGKVKYLGVSVYTNEQIEDVIEDKDVDIIQFPFNLFDNLNLRGDVLKKAKEKNKIIHTRSAFLQGLFFASLEKKTRIIQSLKQKLRYIHQLSDQSAISIQKMALNYCLQQINIDNVLIGVDNLNQLNQNLSDADFSLTESIVDKINTLNITDTDLLNPSLWNQ